MEEEGCVYIIYVTLNYKNRDIVYLLLDIWLYAVETLKIL